MEGTELYTTCRQGNATKLLKIIDKQYYSLMNQDKKGMTLLHHAVKDGHYDVCKVLLEKADKYGIEIGHDIFINVRCSNGENALVMALMKGDLAILQLLVSCKALPYSTDDQSILQFAASMPDYEQLRALLPYKMLNHVWKGKTALYIASRNGYAHHVSLLLNAGADPNIICEKGMTALHIAAKYGYPEIVSLLLAAGVNPNILQKHSSDGVEATPIHLAVAEGHLNIVKQLVCNGAKCNLIMMPTVRSPLHLAAKFGYSNIVHYLLSSGANGQAEDARGQRPHEVGCDSTFFEHGYSICRNQPIDPNEIEKLIELDADMSHALLSYLNNSELHVEVFRLYLASGYESIPEVTVTKLMCRSCEKGDIDVAFSLLAAGMWSPEDQTQKEKVILITLKQKQFELFNVLLDTFKIDAKSYNVFMKNSVGVQSWSLLHEIIASTKISDFDKIPILRFLTLDVGCEVENSRDILDRTPLLLACEKMCDLELIKTLVEHGARVNTQQGSSKMNAIFTYISSEPARASLEVIQFLLDTGAEIDVQSVSGETLLMFAARYQLLRVVSILEQHLHTKVRNLQSRC